MKPETPQACPCMHIDDWLELDTLRKSKLKLFLRVAIDFSLGIGLGCLFALLIIVLAMHRVQALQAEGTRASGEVSASCASSQPLPDGNHGENVSTGSGL